LTKPRRQKKIKFAHSIVRLENKGEVIKRGKGSGEKSKK